jgi:uroporphyrinogen decarboxylase
MGQAAEPVTATGGKLLLDALHGYARTQPPVWLMRQAGRYLPEYRALRAEASSFLEFCYRPDLAVEATLQPIRRFGMDGAILFSDILVVPDALGQRVAFVEGQGPVLEAIGDARAVARLETATVVERLAPVYEAVRRLVRALPSEVTLIGFAGAPWTVATYMVEGGGSRDFARVKRWAFAAPDDFQRLIDILVEVTAAHLCAQLEAGAHAVQLFDSWAGVLPEPAFRRWCIAPVRAVVERVKARQAGAPVIAFPRGAGVLYAGYAAATGADAVSIDSAVPLDWARRSVQTEAVVQGNLDPVMLLAGGQAMADEVVRIREALGGGPFVFNLGHGVLPDTPPDHVAALVRLIRGG